MAKKVKYAVACALVLPFVALLAPTVSYRRGGFRESGSIPHGSHIGPLPGYQLDARYPHLREEQCVPSSRNTIGAPIQHLDLATILKLSQAVSGEIVQERLIETLLRGAIEHAGAERGLLILPRGLQWSLLRSQLHLAFDTLARPGFLLQLAQHRGMYSRLDWKGLNLHASG